MSKVRNDPFMARKPIHRKIKERPVRVAGVLLGIILYLITVTVGQEAATSAEPVLSLLVPIVAGYITERFTFSQAFLQQVLDMIGNYGTQDSVIRTMNREDPRVGKMMVKTGTNNPPPRDRGASVVEALLIVLVVIVVLFLLGLLRTR